MGVKDPGSKTVDYVYLRCCYYQNANGANFDRIKMNIDECGTSYTNDYFCKIDAPFLSYQKQVEARDAKLAQFETAARDGVEVTIISTDKKLGLSFQNPQGRRWAVGVYAGNETLCSLDEHNADQHSTKVTLLIAATVWFVLSSAYFVIMAFLAPLPRKKKI